MHIFAIRYTSRHTRSCRKPGQVGILTHREAKWIILILLEGSALHRVIEQHAALSLTITAGFLLEVGLLHKNKGLASLG